MPWIEYHTALRDHWKIKRLATILEADYLYALGAVSCLWLWVAEYSPNGDVNKFSDAEIRDAARCNNEKMTLDALKKCELVDERGRINDWNQHGLKLLNSKRKRQREYMRRRRQVDVNSTSTIPNHTIPNHTINTTAQEIYDYYAKSIKAGAKEDAIRNILRLLKEGSKKEDLLGRIDAYKVQLQKKPTDKQYYIQANNFFGRAARYKDFEPVKQKVKAADPNCKLCGPSGSRTPGWVFNQEKGGNVRCPCTIVV